jgi:PAS domain S-box-containing protein
MTASDIPGKADFAPTASSQDSLRILVIDDTPAIHEDFRKILRRVDIPEMDRTEAVLFGAPTTGLQPGTFTLDSAYQGQEGLALVQQAVKEGRPYALTFVDVRMPPGWDGIETIAKLWQLDAALQVVVCTAYSDYSWEDMAARFGQTDNLVILKKPFDNVEVLQLAHALTKKWLLGRQSRLRLQDLDRLVAERTQDLRVSNEKLQHQAQELQLRGAALESAANSILITDRDGVIRWHNAAFTQLTGYRPEEALGRKSNLLKSGEHDANFYEQLWGTIVAGRVWRGEITNRCKDGGLYTVEMTITPVHGPDGAITHYVAIQQDVTPRRQAEEALRSAQEQLRQSQKMEAIGQLAGGVAHDFNNLLTVIQGNTELVLMNPDRLAPETRECLGQVAAAAERAANLTRQLLAFGRKQIMEAQPLDLNEVVGNLTKMLKRIIGEDIQLQCSFAARLPLVRADIGMLEQVLVNLVVNARDAMPNGGQVMVTTASARLDAVAARAHAEGRAGDFVVLTVSDTGCGIKPEHLPRIFEPFFTTKEVGKGTGLGLATAYGIIKQHQGWLDVASQVGRGATFKFFLPAMESSPVMSAPPAAPAKPRGGTETILLVEDDEAVRTLTRRFLENYGYRVREAPSGAEALELWRTAAPEIALLLTDLVMPKGVTGRDLAERLRRERPALKVVFMSGYSGDVLGSETGFFHRPNSRFVPKPCAPRALLQTIRDCLDARE